MLVLMILLTSFTGCVKKTDSNDANVQTSGKSSEKPVQSTKEVSNFNPVGLPIVNEKITLKMMGSRHSAQGPWEDTIVMKWLEEETNIHMDVYSVPSDVYAEKKNLAFASGDLPDIFFKATLSVKDEEAYGSQNLLVSLNDLIPKYAPNFSKILKEKPHVKKAISSIEGKIYSLPYVYYTNSMANVRYINTKWLENVGMKIPETIDDFYQALKAFKDMDPNGNNQKDEIPMTDVNIGGASFYLLPAFGFVTSAGNRWDAKDNKAVYIPLQNEYKEFIIYMRKLYSEGLLDQNIFTHKTAELDAKLGEYRVGVMNDSLAKIPEEKQDEYRVLPPLTSHLNSQKMTYLIPGYVTGTYAITNKNKYPEASMRWVDLFYSEPKDAINGICGFTMFRGKEGEHWVYENDERTLFSHIPLPDGKSGDYYLSPFRNGGAPMYITSALSNKNSLLSTRIKVEGSAEHYFPYMNRVGYPGLRYTEDENEKKNSIEDELGKYVSQMEVKFILGEEPIENWDAFIERIKSIGIDEVIKIRQTALDRWNSF